MMDDAKKYIAWGMDGGVHDALSLKPITTPEQQIGLLKGKGVTFERCAEERAQDSFECRDLPASLCLPGAFPAP